MDSISLSQFRALSATVKGDAVLAAQTDAKKGATLRWHTVRKTSVETNRQTRFALYNALTEAGHSQEFLKAARKTLGLDDAKAVLTPLKNRVVRQILGDAVSDQFVHNKEKPEAYGFEVIDRVDVETKEPETLQDFLRSSGADKVRDSRTPQRRNQLISLIRDQAAHKGISLTRAQLSRLDVAGLKKVAKQVLNLPAYSDPILCRSTKGKLLQYVETLAEEQCQINTNETLDAIGRLDVDKKFASNVSFSKEFKGKSGERVDTLRELLADLSLDIDTTLHDGSGSSAARMLQTLKKHPVALAQLLGLNEKTLLTFVTPSAAPFLHEVRQLAAALLNVKPESFDTFSFGRIKYNNDVKTALTNLESSVKAGNDEAKSRLAAFDAGVEKLVNDQCASFQGILDKAFTALISGENVDFESLLMGEQKLKETLVAMGVVEAEEAANPQADDAAGNVKSARLVLEAKLKSAYFKDLCPKMNELDRQLILAAFDKKCSANEGKLPSAFPKSIKDEKLYNVQLQGFIQSLDSKFERLMSRTAPRTPPDSTEYVELSPSALARLNSEERAEYDSLRIKATSLKDLAGKGALDPTSGYGKFLMEVMKTYFGSVNILDKRAMISSLFREAPKGMDLSLAGGIDSEKGRELMGATLGAFFKGAGPIMQKTLQQLASLDLPDTFKAALKDMRCNLQPLPEKTIHAMLADLVEKSNGAIRHLEVVQSLGAASVAQSVECKLTDANGNERSVVVKLIRPEAENRANREKGLFLEAAEKNGMKVSYQGKIDRIMEEFDLRIEEDNAKEGAVYNKKGTMNIYDSPLERTASYKFDDVHSVKVDPLSPNTRSAMIMAKAPGKTIASLMENTEKEVEDILKPYEENKKKKTGGQKALFSDYVQTQKKLVAAYKRLKKAQDQMLHFSRTWTADALFSSGYFHGDAHAGNLMVDLAEPDNKGLTVIDFGNATKLTSTQRKDILRVVGACYINDEKAYVSAFGKLLSPAGQTFLNEHKDAVSARVKEILTKGTENDVGYKIAATLNELQKMGVEIPPTIFNFSQCEIMLEGTVDQMNTQLALIRDKIKAVRDNADSSIKASVQNEGGNTLGDMVGEDYNFELDIGLPESIRKTLETGQVTDGVDKDMESFFAEYPECKLVYETYRLSDRSQESKEKFQKDMKKLRREAYKSIAKLDKEVGEIATVENDSYYSFVAVVGGVIFDNKLATLSTLGLPTVAKFL